MFRGNRAAWGEKDGVFSARQRRTGGLMRRRDGEQFGRSSREQQRRAGQQLNGKKEMGPSCELKGIGGFVAGVQAAAS
jgi:hypothetical protein